MWVSCFVFASVCVSFGYARNCRGEEPKGRDCEHLCDKNGHCAIRAALLLPKNTSYDVSLSSVKPVFDLAFQHPQVRSSFPSWLDLEIITYDVTNCDSAYATISSIDAYNDCAQVFFGPACDYALAPVARIAKFLGNTGIPMVTTGGFTFDFALPKQSCEDEYYMLVRAGLLGFRDLGYFIIDVMKHFNWQQLLLINEPEAQVNIAGKSTCHLTVKTIANFLKIEHITFTPWDITSDGGKNFTENLKFQMAYRYTSKCVFEVFGFL